MTRRTWLLGGFTLFILLLVVLAIPRTSVIANVPTGEVGIITRAGVMQRVVGPGQSLKLPLVESVHRISVRPSFTRLVPVSAATSDGFPVRGHVSVVWHVNPDHLREAFAQFRTDLRPAIENALPVVVRDILGKQPLDALVAPETRFDNDLTKKLAAAVPAYITLEHAQFDGIDYLPPSDRAISSILEVRRVHLDTANRVKMEQDYRIGDEAQTAKQLAVQAMRDDARLVWLRKFNELELKRLQDLAAAARQDPTILRILELQDDGRPSKDMNGTAMSEPMTTDNSTKSK